MSLFPETNETTALLIIDVQYGFMNAHTDFLPASIEDLQNRYSFVMATKFFNAENSPFRTFMQWRRFDEGSQETGLAFSPSDKAVVLEKSTYNCTSTGYLDLLEREGIKTVHIAGCDTNMCVTQSAIKLFETGRYRPIVLAPFCASHSGSEYHECGLKLLEKSIGREQIWTGA